MTPDRPTRSSESKSVLLALAAQHDLDVQVIADAAAPAALLVPGQDGCSQLGGTPLLPPKLAWPRWDPTRFCDAEIADARQRIAAHPSTAPHWTKQIARHTALKARGPLPLSFLAQLDLAALQRVHPIGHLPDEGVLSVFLELSEGAGCLCRAEATPPWQVFWFPDRAALRPTPSPNAGERVLAPVQLKAETGWTLPDRIVVEDQEVLSELEDPEFEDLLEALSAAGLRGGNQIDGHIYSVQESDARMCAVLQDAGYDAWNPVRKALTPPADVRAQNWQHLLQIATDYGDYSWVGVSTFWRPQRAWTPGLQPRVQQYYEDT